MSEGTPIVVVLMTAPDAAAGVAIGRALVEQGLAACASVVPAITSVYRWQGEVRSDAEAQVLLKTRRALLPELLRRAAELHPYEVPELIALEAQAAAAYGRWLHEVTASPPAA